MVEKVEYGFQKSELLQSISVEKLSRSDVLVE